MAFEDELNKYAYLWDGSEDWILEYVSGTAYSLKIQFGDSITKRQVLTLRHLFEYFRKLKSRQIKIEVERRAFWQTDVKDHATAQTRARTAGWNRFGRLTGPLSSTGSVQFSGGSSKRGTTREGLVSPAG